MGPTPFGPTTPGIGPWRQIRLPENVKPYHYDLSLHTDVTKPSFNGNVSIWINISSDTRYLLLHATHMNLTRAEVRKVSGGELRFPWHYNAFSMYDQRFFSHRIPSNICYHSNGNTRPLILSKLNCLEIQSDVHFITKLWECEVLKSPNL